MIIKKSDMISILFSEWWDKNAGVTYTDATVQVNSKTYQVPFNHIDGRAQSRQAINDALKYLGFKLSKARSVDDIHTWVADVRYGQLNKVARREAKS